MSKTYYLYQINERKDSDNLELVGEVSANSCLSALEKRYGKGNLIFLQTANGIPVYYPKDLPQVLVVSTTRKIIRKSAT